MCELLLRVVDVVHAGDPVNDLYRNARASHRGDVIVVLPDGANWGRDGYGASCWRVLKIPAMTVNEASVLLAPERDTDPLNPSKTVQRKAFKLDVDNVALPADLRAYLADDNRTQPTFTINLTAAQIQPFIVRKSPIVVP